MFKFVVFCAALSLASAKPGTLLAAPLAYSSTIISPASTTLSQHSSSVVHPSPLVYSAPLTYTHYIKKRSAQVALSSYLTPTTYAAGIPLVTSTYTAPLVHSAPILPGTALTYAAPAHLIKKRSAVLPLSTTYITPTTYAASAPLLTSPYTAASPYISTAPYISSSPLAYSTHLIKKRSALVAYLAPTAVSHQSRIDLQSTPLITSFGTPYTYSSPIAINHVY